MWWLTIILALIPCITGPISDKWDECKCRWDEWEQWSSCTSTCGGGYQSRSRSVWNLDTPNCVGFESCATSDMGWDYRRCSTTCFNGGTFIPSGTLYGYCSCITGYTGRCCETQVNCGDPGRISNGNVIGNEFTYNKEITYICDVKHNLTGAATRRCTQFGYWTGTTPQCSYAYHCDSNPCKNGADCINYLGFYTCRCLPGWSGRNCEIDIQPPIVDGCPINRTVYTSELTVTETWNIPNFTDPMNTTLIIEKNFENSSFVFPWGDFSVQFIATKPINGLKTECVFSIKIRPFPCTELQVPTSGALMCNDWSTEFARVCSFICRAGYTFHPGFKASQWYNCGASGKWTPSVQPTECIQNDFTDFLDKEANGCNLSNCSDSSEINTCRHCYIEKLKVSPFVALCQEYGPECRAENVFFSC